MEKYLQRAKMLSEFFGVYGQGNFDVSREELAEILRLVEEDDGEGLGNLYERLHHLRMGEAA